MADTTAAEAYENFMVPFVFEAWARQVIDDAGLQPGQKVLDVGCGTGIAARLAAIAVGHGGRVVGIDIDDGMLAVARRAVVPDGAAEIEWQRADATALPFPDAGFDAVLCFEALQFFPDRAKALAEFHRVLKPGGRLLGTVWGRLEDNPGYHALAKGLSEFVSPDAGRLPPFLLHDADAIRASFDGAGFADITVTPRQLVRPIPSVDAFVQWVAAGAPTVRLKLSLLPEDKRAAFLRFVEQRLEGCRNGDAFALPTMRHVFTAVTSQLSAFS